MWLVPHCTQWFCWSLSPYFHRNPVPLKPIRSRNQRISQALSARTLALRGRCCFHRHGREGDLGWSWWLPLLLQDHPQGGWMAYDSNIHGIWVNYNISLTWIVRPFGDDSPYELWFPGFARSELVIIYPDGMEHDIVTMDYNDLKWSYIWLVEWCSWGYFMGDITWYNCIQDNESDWHLKIGDYLTPSIPKWVCLKMLGIFPLK